VRNISNSEVTCWLSCKQMYHFAFMLSLTPKDTVVPLARGTLGHEAFQRYIEARLEGSNHEQSLKNADTSFNEAMKVLTIDLVLETKFLWSRYMEFHRGWPEFELLGTEQRHDLALTDTLGMPMRYDVLVKNKQTDKVLIGDFKFTYDFWKPEEHGLNGQMPKYIQVLNNNGIEVHGGFLEEVRTRKLGEEKSSDPKNLWKRTYYYPSNAKKRSVLQQHVAASLQIERYRNLPDDEREIETIPVLNKHGACKNCNFKDLCISKLDGKKDLTLDIKLGYVENTYGYNEQPDTLAALESLL